MTTVHTALRRAVSECYALARELKGSHPAIAWRFGAVGQALETTLDMNFADIETRPQRAGDAGS